MIVSFTKRICKMQQRELEVTVTSAQDLKNVRMFGKMTPYAVAWVEPNIKVPTPIARKGGVNPTWNALLKLIADQRILNHPNAKLHINIYNPGYFSEELVGSCSVPLSCLKEKDSNGAYGEQFMSCEVPELMNDSPTPFGDGFRGDLLSGVSVGLRLEELIGAFGGGGCGGGG